MLLVEEDYILFNPPTMVENPLCLGVMGLGISTTMLNFINYHFIFSTLGSYKLKRYYALYVKT
jgi:succinate-acetate transporter protein